MSDSIAVPSELFMYEMLDDAAQGVADLAVLWHILHRRCGCSNRQSLSWPEFQLLLGTGWNAMIVKRLFDILDSDHDGIVGRNDFISGLRPTLPSACVAERVRFLFACFDLEASGGISRESLLVHLHLHASRQDTRQGIGPSMSEEACETIVRETLAGLQLDEYGRIGLVGFTAMLDNNPILKEQLLQQLELDVTRATALHVLAGSAEEMFGVGIDRNDDDDHDGGRDSTDYGVGAGQAGDRGSLTRHLERALATCRTLVMPCCVCQPCAGRLYSGDAVVLVPDHRVLARGMAASSASTTESLPSSSSSNQHHQKYNRYGSAHVHTSDRTTSTRSSRGWGWTAKQLPPMLL